MLGPEGSLVEALLLLPRPVGSFAPLLPHPFFLLLLAPPFPSLLLNLSSSFPASPPSTISRDLAQNIADRVGAILGLRLVVGEGKAAKGDYSKYRKPPPGIQRSGTPQARGTSGVAEGNIVLCAPRWSLGGRGMPVSALGFEGSGAALAARGVSLPADLGGGVRRAKREGRTARGGPSMC